VRLTFGASGLLRDRIAGGEPADVLASANMEHPEALAKAGRAAAVQRFARNGMCLLVRPGVELKPETLASRMLDPALKLGTSTPKSDPAGDYAWQVFDRIEQDGRPGAARILAAKALQLTGGPQSPPAPADRSVYGVLVAQGAADLFLIYCTNAVIAAQEQPGLQVIRLPENINVSASYGITLLNGAPSAAQRFVDFVLTLDGQAVLARYGFAPP
jgi:ABC-type molybdate transport system substrate-binding protein